MAFFPASVYKNVGACDVLPTLLQSLKQDDLSTLQFLRNGAARLTFKSAVACDAVISSGINFGDVSLRLVACEARSRLIHLRDCPAEVPDSTVLGFFGSFGEVHSITRGVHDKFPGLQDGNRVLKMSLTKDVPTIVRVAGFDCRVWYSRQPTFCVICKKSGHRPKNCSLNGLCRRCRRPGHMARECSGAWGGAPAPAPAATAAPAAPAPAAAPPAASDSSAVPPGPAATSVVAGEDSDMDYIPGAEESDDCDAVSMNSELLSGDEEVLISNQYLPPPPPRVSTAPTKRVSTKRKSRRSRAKRRRTAPSHGPAVVCEPDIASSPMDGSPVSAPVSEPLVLSSLLDDSHVSVPLQYPDPSVCFEESVMDLDVDSGPNIRLYRTFRGVWKDVTSWEELRARKDVYAVLSSQDLSSSSVLFPPPAAFSSSTPVSLDTPVPSSFSSDGSVVASVLLPPASVPSCSGAESASSAVSVSSGSWEDC